MGHGTHTGSWHQSLTGPNILYYRINQEMSSFWDFPGGPEFKTQCSQCRGTGSIPGQGTKTLHATRRSPTPPKERKRQKEMPSFCSYEVDFPITVP